MGFGGYGLRPVWAEGERRIPRLPAVSWALSSSMTPSPAPPRSIGPQARVGAQTPGQHPPPKLRAAPLSEQGRVGQSSQAGAEVGTKSPRPLLRGWPGLHGCHVLRCPVGTRGPGTGPHTAPQKGPEQRGLRSLLHMANWSPVTGRSHVIRYTGKESYIHYVLGSKQQGLPST